MNEMIDQVTEKKKRRKNDQTGTQANCPMVYGIILWCGQLHLAQREFDHLCEKDLWPKAICSHVLIKKFSAFSVLLYFTETKW